MLKHLTLPRLATLQAFFKTKTDQDLLGCYAWNQAVGSALLPILGDLEVALRDALHRALSQHFGGIDSLLDDAAPQPCTRCEPGRADVAIRVAQAEPRIQEQRQLCGGEDQRQEGDTLRCDA